MATPKKVVKKDLYYLSDGEVYESLGALINSLTEKGLDDVSDGDSVLVLQEVGVKYIRNNLRIE